MSETPAYTEYHPRWYRPKVSTWWWLGRRSYLVFILRELSSVFIFWFIAFTLMQIRAISRGMEAYHRFLTFAEQPGIIILNVVTFCFVVFHAVTWFQLAPKAMVLHFRGKKVPGRWLVFANFALWIAVSLVLALIVLSLTADI